MLEHFRHFLHTENLNPDKNRILTGVSGGVDSMVLVHLFLKAGFKVGVAHVNYGMRGVESEKDEQLVAEMARSHNLPFFTVKFPKSQFTKGNFQDNARAFRYAWFHELAQINGFDKIAMGHHADDQIETFFLQFFRSSGIEGLAGMKYTDNSVIRPLLAFFKKELYEYAEKHKIAFSEDVSNETDVYKRNKIRNQLIPYVEEQFGDVRKNMIASINHLADTSELLYHLIDKIPLVSKDFGSIKIDLNTLRKAPKPEQLLFAVIKKFGFNHYQTTDILSAESGGKILADEFIALKENDYIRVFKRTEEKYIYSIEATEFGLYVLPFGNLKIFPLESYREEEQHSLQVICFNEPVFPLLIRGKIAGDYFQPSGMGGKSKSVKKFLSDTHFDAWQRERCVLVQKNQEITAILPLRVANGYCNKNESKSLVGFLLEYKS